MQVKNLPEITPRYWAAILIASRHGLDLGLPVSTMITGSMLAAVVVLWPHRGSVPAPTVVEPNPASEGRV